MRSGEIVTMNHPDGYATITGRGGDFVGWIPNGIQGVIYLFTPDARSAVVQFDGKLVAAVPVEHLRTVGAAPEPAA